MSRPAHCKNCGAEISVGERKVLSGKSFCDECYNQLKIEKKQKKKEPADSEYMSLMRTICEHYDIPKPTGLILKQIQRYKAECDYTYAGMEYTLNYVWNMTDNGNSDVKYGVYQISDYYDEAREYYERQEILKRQMENFTERENIVKINKSTNVRKQQSAFTVDLDALLKGGE